jgi:protein-L-isoaspartate(D-aspartate) O-methyltransferase
MSDDPSFTRDRCHMVDTQIINRGVRDPRVLVAMRSVPRHCFVPSEYLNLAYTDGPLPIGSGQTISQPYIVALMSELMELKGDETVLEVGTGSGYQAAVLAELAKEVHTIERHPNLARYAEKILQELAYDNIQIHIGDGSLGLPEYAPFTAIMVTAAAPDAPKTILDQLAENGRLVIPVGSRGGQYLERWRRQGNKFDREEIIPVAFVPLIGEHGWKTV